ncbi:hypothetical protein [Lysinibacillus antri]|uniref:Uncharacterized protein n=1 Tax=Lysinibacillus antri TaxID=2498145 RepID=A0A3S0P666_9BACI|nr:hypothetical protein [Lysinibacillus antri]RUL56466.1 hypothetical protein EK386_02200 [Lysinibacillus antri]
MSMYNFSRLINKYSGPITVFVTTKGGWVNGKPVESEPIPETRQAALIPFDVKTIAQLGGLVTNADVQLYSLAPFVHGDKIEKNGQKYTVDTSADFTQFGDFYRYIAKGVSSFD